MHTRGDGLSRGFLPHIEGLRAVAVLLVMLYHAGLPQLPGGFIGVDVFFVISGFLITGLLIRELDDNGRLDLTRFYARRIRRLLPASTVVLIATVVAAWLIVPPLRWRAVGVDALASALWSGNIRFALAQTDYLTADDAPSPLLHFWSLGVEEQYYLIWPVLLAMAFAAGWRWFSARTVVAVVAGVTLLASLYTSLQWTGTQQPYAFFLLPSRAWELAAGALLAAGGGYLSSLHRHVRSVLGVAGLLTIAFSAVLLDSSVRWPGYAAAIPVLATLAVISSGGLPVKLLSVRPLLAVGRWSYSLYLWHWPVLVLAPIAFGRKFSLVEALGALLVSLLFAVLSHRFVENPLRSHRVLMARSWRSFALGCALVGLSGASAAALNVAPLPQAPVVAGTVTTSTDASEDPYAPLLTAVETVSGVPADLTPGLLEAEDDRFSVDLGECFAPNPVDSAPKKGCYYGDLTASRTVALIGDSHAAQWTGALLAIAKQEGFRLLILTKSACPPVQLQRSSATLGTFPECRRWNASVMERLERERPEVTLVAGYSGYSIKAGLDPYDHRLQAWGATFDQLGAFSRPVLIADTPYPNHDVPVCLSANMADVAACVRTSKEMRNAAASRTAELDAAQTRSVPHVNTFDLVCPTQRCPIIVENVLVYRDQSHISATFAIWLTEALAAKLVPLLDLR